MCEDYEYIDAPVPLPEHISDEAAAELLELLYALIKVVETRYYDKISRHHDISSRSCPDFGPPLPDFF
jgi:hypothetical protein